jgi:hypothetical protein
MVFTIPSSMHRLFYANQAICYDLLMKSASEAILKAGKNPAFLGAKTGCVAILHTWGQALTYHPHVHLLVPSGGFDNDMLEWRQSEDADARKDRCKCKGCLKIIIKMFFDIITIIKKKTLYWERYVRP